MKSTKVQNPRRISLQANNYRLLATPHGVAVHSPVSYFRCYTRALAASVCLVWGEAEPATRSSRTILCDALLVAIARAGFMPHLQHARAAQHRMKYEYACATLIDGLG